MSLLNRFAAWLFACPSSTSSNWKIVAWWEVRRIPFNIVVGLYGIVCLSVFYWSMTTSGGLQPGEDAVEPIAILLAPFGINALYTLGWLVEIPARVLNPNLSPTFGPLLFKLGLGLGLVLITLPAALGGGYRLLQIAGFLA